MKNDRNLQKTLLEDLYDQYPAGHAISHWVEYKESDYDLGSAFHIHAQLFYLWEHDLVIFVNNPRTDTRKCIQHYVTITAKGIDFLLNDGGLSTILNSITVKFDINNITEILETQLLQVNLPKEEKNKIIEALKKAPATAVQSIVAKFIEKGMTDPLATAKTLVNLLNIHL